jgi:hypothetical protein
MFGVGRSGGMPKAAQLLFEGASAGQRAPGHNHRYPKDLRYVAGRVGREPSRERGPEGEREYS